jgi:hypothetical protein
MSRAVSTKKTSWFWRRKSCVGAFVFGGRIFSPGTSKTLIATPQVVFRSGVVGCASLARRTHAG